jgi:hypothetical protein
MKKGIMATFRIRHGAEFAQRPTTKSDYEIYASYLVNAGGQYLGSLKVVRKTDGRLVFPFVGAPTIGPFPDKQAARDAAIAYGEQIVAADIANPEDF